MTVFEVMGEHYPLTAFGLGVFSLGLHHTLNVVAEGMRERTRRLHADTRSREQQRLLDMLDSSAGRLSYLREHEATAEEMVYELEHSHRIQVALGWRTDEFPPGHAIVRANADQLREWSEQMQEWRPSRAHMPFLESGSQSVPPRPSTGAVGAADETSVDTLTGSGAGSPSESLETQNDPSNHPRNRPPRRRSIRPAG